LARNRCRRVKVNGAAAAAAGRTFIHRGVANITRDGQRSNRRSSATVFSFFFFCAPRITFILPGRSGTVETASGHNSSWSVVIRIVVRRSESGLAERIVCRCCWIRSDDRPWIDGYGSRGLCSEFMRVQLKRCNFCIRLDWRVRVGGAVQTPRRRSDFFFPRSGHRALITCCVRNDWKSLLTK